MIDDKLPFELVLPAGTRTVKVNDLPNLLASALHGEHATAPPLKQWDWVRAHEEFATKIPADVRRGALITIDPITGESPAIVNRVGGVSVMLVAVPELTRYARSLSIAVRLGEPSPTVNGRGGGRAADRSGDRDGRGKQRHRVRAPRRLTPV